MNGLTSGIESLALGLDKIGASGTTFMVVLGGAVVLMKSLTLITALNAKVAALAAGTQSALTTRMAFATIATKAKT